MLEPSSWGMSAVGAGVSSAGTEDSDPGSRLCAVALALRRAEALPLELALCSAD